VLVKDAVSTVNQSATNSYVDTDGSGRGLTSVLRWKLSGETENYTKILGEDIRNVDLVSNPLPPKYQSEALMILVSAVYEYIKLAASNPGQDTDLVSNPHPPKYQSEALPFLVSAVYEYIKLATSNPGQDTDISSRPSFEPATS
jgi:hypothetical protein